jgi:hypothetical protein
LLAHVEHTAGRKGRRGDGRRPPLETLGHGFLLRLPRGRLPGGARSAPRPRAPPATTLADNLVGAAA